MARLDPTGVSRILSYIKNWVTTALGGKANSSHNHTKSQITDFPTIPTRTSQLTNNSGFITSNFSTTHTRGTAPENAVYKDFLDYRDSASNRICLLESVVSTDKSSMFGMYAYNTSIASGGNIGYLGIGSKADGTVLTHAPTPAASDSSTQIATTAWVTSKGYITSSGSCNYANSAGSVAWGNVSGKPSSYTPSSHNHDSVYLKLSGGTITGNISKNNAATSWVQGRNAAPFRTIAASSPGDSQYVPCWSAKSYQGSWDCGPYTSNVLHLSYITDANYNSGSNTQTADFTFATDGTFNAKVLKQNGTVVSLSGHTHTKSQITDFPTIPTVNNATLTIQKNGSNVATFTSNASSNVTANITVPTKTSQLTNDSGFITGISWGNVSSRPYMVDNISYKSINASYSTQYRTQTKGNTSHNAYISVIRTDTNGVSKCPVYGSGIASGMSDTHMYIYCSYSGADAYIGGGNADKLNWISRINVEDNTYLNGYRVYVG